MPVTVKLSQRFYERFGDEITNELVNWFNEVDATYRADLRQLNEANFSRFDAKLEQRLAEARAEFKANLADLRVDITNALSNVKSDLLRWMFAFWVSTALALIALLRK